jgi:hypothetical protein
MTNRLQSENHLLNLLQASAAIIVAISHIRAVMLFDFSHAPHTASQTILYGITA